MKTILNYVKTVKKKYKMILIDPCNCWQNTQTKILITLMKGYARNTIDTFKKFVTIILSKKYDRT